MKLNNLISKLESFFSLNEEEKIDNKKEVEKLKVKLFEKRKNLEKKIKKCGECEEKKELKKKIKAVNKLIKKTKKSL